MGEALEDYLEAILILSNQNKAVRSVDLAVYRGYSRASISYAVKELRNKNYLEVNKEDLNILRKFEETAEKRRCCLVESNMKQYIYLLRDIRYFPNAGIYIKDMIYLLKSINEV